ncbi:MAG: anthrone oxygenase family protein [Gammaproteobacteria bacterium]|nr:anthrone oxygenase family protein [Gammaproteobacteria bacterium]
MYALTVFAAIGCGLIAGVFFAFSTFVMKALADVSTESGVSAMQAINVRVLGPWFLGAFFGSALACAALLVWSVAQWDGRASVLLVAGSLSYLLGCFLVTIAFNVPKNKRLAVLSPSARDTEGPWREYLSKWTFWNHVRTVAAAAAALLYCLALGTGLGSG